MDPGNDYDISAAFERIPRDRLAALATDRGPGLLSLELACECEVSAFLFRPDKLVIDISDGQQTAVPTVAEPRFVLASPLATQLELPDVAEAPLIFDVTSPDVSFVAASERSELPAGVLERFAPMLEIEGADAMRIAEVERSLIESLSRANSHGVIDFTGGGTMEDSGIAARSDNLPDLSEGPENTSVPAPTPGATGPGLLIQSSLDRGTNPVPVGQTARAGISCLDDSYFDFAVWGNGRPFADQIADRTTELTGEFDVYADGAVDSLARTYLHFGFGREARQALQLDGLRSSEREILVSLAAILDEEIPPNDLLIQQFGCVGAVSLWSALARKTILGTGEEERTAMITAHRNLPEAIRALTGLLLADLFLEVGDHAAAAEILAPGIGMVQQTTVEVGMAEAEIVRQAVGAGPAIDRLNEMVDDGSRMTAAAMTELLTLSLVDGMPVDEATLTLASALRFEERGTASAAALAVAELRTLIASDRFEQAQDLIANDTEDLPAEVFAGMETELVVAAAERMADSEFLYFAFGGTGLSQSDRSVNAVARRLIALGFPEEADRLLDAPAEGDDMLERGYLGAEAAISMGRDTAAAGALAGMSGPRADALRARIPSVGQTEAQVAEAEGDLPTAYLTLPVLGLESNADLSGLPAEPDQNPSTIFPPAATLAARRLILEEASRARTLAEESLAARPSEFGGGQELN